MNLLTFLSDLFSALAHAKEAADTSGAPDGDYRIYNDKKSVYDVSTVDTQSAAPPGWSGPLPYRYIDVSRYQGQIDWAQVAAAGYKGAMLKTVSTNPKLSKRADGLYIDPTFERNYRDARAAGLDVGVYYYTYATSEAMADAGSCAWQGAHHARVRGRGRKQAQKALHARPHQRRGLCAGKGGSHGLLCPVVHLHGLQL